MVWVYVTFHPSELLFYHEYVYIRDLSINSFFYQNGSVWGKYLPETNLGEDISVWT